MITYIFIFWVCYWICLDLDFFLDAHFSHVSPHILNTSPLLPFVLLHWRARLVDWVSFLSSLTVFVFLYACVQKFVCWLVKSGFVFIWLLLICCFVMTLSAFSHQVTCPGFCSSFFCCMQDCLFLCWLLDGNLLFSVWLLFFTICHSTVFNVFYSTYLPLCVKDNCRVAGTEWAFGCEEIDGCLFVVLLGLMTMCQLIFLLGCGDKYVHAPLFLANWC